MGKSTPQAPTPVDPVATANAQTASNVATAQANQKLNMVGSYGPTGSVTYHADPTQPGGYSQYTSLSPQEQQSYNLSKQAENSAYGVANDQIGRVGQALGQGFNYDSLPGLRSDVQGGQLQTGVGGDLNAARQQTADAAYGQATSRLDPRFATQEEQLRQRLADQGLSQNSAAYGNAMDAFGRDKNDAYNQAQYSAIGAGNTEAQNLFSRQLGQGQFANSAQDQGYSQNLQSAQFQNQARTQGAQEQAYAQNLPLNQFNSLMSSGQVGMPTGIQYTPAQQSNTDVLGAYALNQQGQQQNYQAKLQAQQAGMQGLYQLGSAAAMAFAGSDVRIKKDITRVGTLDSGLPVYTFRYKAGGPMQMGVMAQDVLKVKPEAVADLGGYLGVNYGML